MLGDDVKSFGEILAQQEDIIRQVFFDVKQVEQLKAMQEIFGELWPKTFAEGSEVYTIFSAGSANSDERIFKDQGRIIIEDYSRTLISKQVQALWLKKTGAKTPDAWSRAHRLPAELILAVENAQRFVDAVEKPEIVSAEHLQFVLDELQKDDAFVDIESAGAKLLRRVLPVRYQKLGFSANELSEWLFENLGDMPGQWLMNVNLRQEVEKFVKEKYNSHTRKQVADQVNLLSDADAKKLLLKIIDQIPDAGLSILG